MQYRFDRRRKVWTSIVVIALAIAVSSVANSRTVLGEETDSPPVTGRGVISGKVILDDGGAPAADAEVTLLLPLPPDRDYYVWPLPIRVAKSDAMGRFSFDQLSSGKYRVWANRGKLTSRRESLRGAQVEITDEALEPKPVELKMHAGVALTTIVKDAATGKPISKGIVHVGWSDTKVDNFATDDQGEVVVQPLTPQRWFIEARGAGYARKSEWVNLENGTDSQIEFLLSTGGNLRGIVRDPAGQPVSNMGLSFREPGQSHQLVYITTNNQGRFSVESLPRNVALECSYYKQDYLRETVNFTLTDAEEAVEWTVHPRPHGGSLAGTVTDQEGRPVADAELTNMGNSSADVRTAKSDKQGKFLLDNVYEGSRGHEVTVRARRFAPLRMQFKPGPADKPAQVDIALDAGHTIKGRVQDEAGNPLEGVTVYFAHGNQAFSDGGKGQTDKNGQFEFDSLPAECPFTFYKTGFSSLDEHQLELDQAEVAVVTLVPSGTLAGVVVDEQTGRPIPKFRVRLTFSPQRKPNDPSAGINSDLVSPGQTFQSADGKFQIKDLLLGMPFQVMIDADGYEPGVWERIETQRSNKFEFEKLALERIDPKTLTTYRGRLLDPGEKPAAGVTLRLIVSRPRKPGPRNAFPFNWEMIRSGQITQQSGVLRFLEGKSNADGKFEFAQVPRDAEVELVWWGDKTAPGRSDHLETFDEQERLDLTIGLQAPGRIHGTIDRVAHPDVSSISIQSPTGASESHYVSLKSTDKTFDVSNLAPGKYQVVLYGPQIPVKGQPGAFTHQPVASTAVDLEEGETIEVDFAPE